MKAQRKKKKVEPPKSKEAEVETKSEETQTPTNLLSDHIEPEEIKVEGEPMVEKKEELPMIETKPAEVKNEEVVSTADVIAPAVSTPPIESPPSPAPTPISMDSSQSFQEQPPKKNFFWVLLLVVLLAALGLGGWFYYSNFMKKPQTSDQSKKMTSSSEVKNQPTKVMTEDVKVDKYPIKILNGSGIAGEAGKVKEILEKEGFKVSDTGNADNYDHIDTVVQTKKSVEKNFVDKLEKLLSESYSLGKNESLSASDSSDVVIIVGSKKK